VETRKEEWEFFVGQCYKEIKRVTMMNYDMGRETLTNVGEMMLRLIYKMNVGWQDFLSYYTNFNVERKQYDEKFLEERGILEEFEDQVLSSEDEEDEYYDDEIPGVLIPEEGYQEKKKDWRVDGEWL
jgi:hypothetical protein